MRTDAQHHFKSIQSEICAALAKLDGKATFSFDEWQRSDLSGSHGGGGITRVMRDGGLFESAGVNFSAVEGTLPAEMAARLVNVSGELPFFATGISLVLHPLSPMVPTTHANFRYLEVGEQSWFGGGMDLTPYYLFEEDCRHFHQTLKALCERHNPGYYPRFKRWCDEYFFLPHRGEGRGVGGIFFDYLGRDDVAELLPAKAFAFEAAQTFLPAYAPIVSRRRGEPWEEAHRNFQLMRRGRYVEFNLLYDRGTLFGLKTNGRVESILMSLPPLVRWEYDAQYAPGSREGALLQVLRQPREWS